MRATDDECGEECGQQLTAFVGRRQKVDDGVRQQFSEREFELAMAVGQEAEVRDALKTGWEGAEAENAGGTQRRRSS